MTRTHAALEHAVGAVLNSGGEAVGPCIEGGHALFAMGCVQGNDAMRLAAAVVLDRTFSPIAAGRATLTAMQAAILTDTMGAEVEPTHVGDDDAEGMGFDTSIVKSAPMAIMIPQLVARTKRAMRCDRASIFLINEARTEYALSFERSDAPTGALDWRLMRRLFRSLPMWPASLTLAGRVDVRAG